MNNDIGLLPRTPTAPMEVGLVGPVWPYRGGIAQYTTRLRQALASVCVLHTISFKRQYPKWLYPGASDREPASTGHTEPGVSYVLDAMSPLSWRRAVHQVVAGGCRHVILNWWTMFWAPAFAYMAWHLRRRGIKVAFLCHNLSDHGAGGVRAWLARRMLSQADAYIVHSSAQRHVLAALYPGKPILQRLHPVYDQFPAATTRLPKRGKLEVLFFGFIRPYKGLKVLLDAALMLDDPDVFFTIVGESWKETSEINEAKRKLGNNLDLHLSYVDVATAATYFDRADIVVLPYLSATGSGVVAVAYHYGKPVLASRVGGLEDAVLPGQTGWLVSPGSPEALAGALSDVNRESAGALQEGINTFVRENSWNGMAEAIRAFLLQDSGTTTDSRAGRGT